MLPLLKCWDFICFFLVFAYIYVIVIIICFDAQKPIHFCVLWCYIYFVSLALFCALCFVLYPCNVFMIWTIFWIHIFQLMLFFYLGAIDDTKSSDYKLNKCNHLCNLKMWFSQLKFMLPLNYWMIFSCFKFESKLKLKLKSTEQNVYHITTIYIILYRLTFLRCVYCCYDTSCKMHTKDMGSTFGTLVLCLSCLSYPKYKSYLNCTLQLGV